MKTVIGSMRGDFIKKTLKYYLRKNLWNIENEKENEKIKLELNRHLSFEVSVKFEIKDGSTFIGVYFDDEEGYKRSIYFTLNKKLCTLGSYVH